MSESVSFSYLEKTLIHAQGLLEAVIEQNKQWPGGGALEEDIAMVGSLLKESELALVEVRDAVFRQAEHVEDVDVKPADEMFDKAYRILDLMYGDIKRIRTSLKLNESQTGAIENLDMHLHKFIKHCEEARHYLMEAAKTERR